MKSWQPTCCLTIGIQRYTHKHTRTFMPTEVTKWWWYFLFEISDSQLDEGINLLLKPRPGSDLTNSNGPSPPQMVQRSVSSTQKPIRRSTDQGERIGSICEWRPFINTFTRIFSLLTLSLSLRLILETASGRKQAWSGGFWEERFK